jgi:hypothetical protein
MECRNTEVDRDNDHSLCSLCFSTLRGTWRKMDEYDLKMYIG